jgi:hypothetical protein
MDQFLSPEQKSRLDRYFEAARSTPRVRETVHEAFGQLRDLSPADTLVGLLQALKNKKVN